MIFSVSCRISSSFWRALAQTSHLSSPFVSRTTAASQARVVKRPPQFGPSIFCLSPILMEFQRSILFRAILRAATEQLSAVRPQCSGVWTEITSCLQHFKSMSTFDSYLAITILLSQNGILHRSFDCVACTFWRYSSLQAGVFVPCSHSPSHVNDFVFSLLRLHLSILLQPFQTSSRAGGWFNGLSWEVTTTG